MDEERSPKSYPVLESINIAYMTTRDEKDIPEDKGRERALAVTKLEEALMWAQKIYS